MYYTAVVGVTLGWVIDRHFTPGSSAGGTTTFIWHRRGHEFESNFELGTFLLKEMLPLASYYK